MLSGASSGGRRGLQALHRLACSGLDATTSSSFSSLFRCDVAGAEQPCHSHGSAAGGSECFSSWAQLRGQPAGQQAVLGHTDCYAAGRSILPAPQFLPRTAASLPVGAAAAGSARGAKAQAAQQRGGSKQQQQSRQRRATAIEYPVENQKGVISVLSTKNNTIVTLADEGGNVKAW